MYRQAAGQRLHKQAAGQGRTDRQLDRDVQTGSWTEMYTQAAGQRCTDRWTVTYRQADGQTDVQAAGQKDVQTIS